ncbi:MAG: hypothetical protein DHS20C01_03590 [marine bacterium B5-7]|nr:MAG: hypothetical protein DHS20C01_03590 [marine bacterium B5-7]
MKILLAPEYTRRWLCLLLIAAAAIVYFHEYLLYTFLYLVNAYRAGQSLDPIPGFEVIDGFVVLGFVLVLVFIYWRPRHYVSIDAGETANGRVIRSGKDSGIVTREDLNQIKISYVSQRRAKSRSSGFITSIRIAGANRPDLIFLDRVNGGYRWRARRVARYIESRIADVAWIDSDGILSGAIPKVTSLQASREKQRKKVADKIRKSAPRVRMQTGSRLVFIGVFTLAGVAFYIGGAKVVGYIFGALAAVMLIDLVFAQLGYGQQPEKKRK